MVKRAAVFSFSNNGCFSFMSLFRKNFFSPISIYSLSETGTIFKKSTCLIGYCYFYKALHGSGFLKPA